MEQKCFLVMDHVIHDRGQGNAANGSFLCRAAEAQFSGQTTAWKSFRVTNSPAAARAPVAVPLYMENVHTR